MKYLLFLLLLLPGLPGCGRGVSAHMEEGYPEFTGRKGVEKVPITESLSFPMTSTASYIGKNLSLGQHPAFSTATLDFKSTPRRPTTTSHPTRSPLPTPTPSGVECLREGGRLVDGTVITGLLRDPLQYRIYLPPCYDKQTSSRYPVLFLFHGLHLPIDQWDRIGVDEAADRLIETGKIPPLIIVMPYDPYTSPPGVNKFDQAIVDGLVPHVDRIFRTTPDRAHRAVGGLSRGGAWAIHLGLAYWQVFGAIGGHSPAIFSNDFSELNALIGAIPDDSYPRIYLDIGDRDDRSLLNDLMVFENRLDQLSVPHEWHYFLGYHNEAYWRAHVDQYLLWYCEGW